MRVIPARLLNFGSHKVIVYGGFSAAERKAVWHFAFSAFCDLCECLSKGDQDGKSV